MLFPQYNAAGAVNHEVLAGLVWGVLELLVLLVGDGCGAGQHDILADFRHHPFATRIE